MMFNFFKKKINRYELSELAKLNDWYNAESFKAKLIKGNTYLVKDGQKLAEQYEQIAKMINDIKNQKISMILAGLGYPPNTEFQVDLVSGKIKEMPKKEIKEDKNDKPENSK